jgi:hypothetical protein
MVSVRRQRIKQKLAVAPATGLPESCTDRRVT